MAHAPPRPRDLDNPPRAASAAPRFSLPSPHSCWLWLLFALPAAGGLFLLSRISYPAFHVLVELSGIVLAAAVFTIGWNTRRLVPSPFFLILASGFLAVGLLDLLHILTYRGVGGFPVAGSNPSTQLWITARGMESATFLLAILRLGPRANDAPEWRWLAGFGGAATLLALAVWPLEIFPTCHVEGVGPTTFKIVSECLVAAVLGAAALLLWRRREQLGPRLANLLLAALIAGIASELSIASSADLPALANFAGHLCKLTMIVLVYHALVEGTLRSPFGTLFRELVALNQNLDDELDRRNESEAHLRAANREFALLDKTARALHSTLHLDALVQLVLSLAVSPQSGGFSRALLFTVNERTGVLQGMLGVDRLTAAPELPVDGEAVADQLRREQRESAFNRLVIKQRLPLQVEDSAVARACLERRVCLVDDPRHEPPGGRRLAEELGLGCYACAPLGGRDQHFGVLLVEFDTAAEGSASERLRFLDLFAGQAAAALENARLLHRLEGAHRELRAVQEQLIQGEKLAVLGEMAAQVAHELKNPLVSVGGFAQRLTRLELNDSRAVEYAAIIAREVRRLEEMLGNILAFSKKQLICLEECDLNQLFYEALSLETEPQQRAGIELLTEIEMPLPALVGDCRQLRQVVLNLLANARQAMPNGGRIVLRSGPCTLRGEEGVVIEVEDSGGGIPAEIMRNIFNPFFSTHPKGTGLGLSISHRIIEQHHGEIEVFNAERGACFIVRLPLHPPSCAIR